MLKKTLILLLLVFLSSCGYKAIHSKKNLVNTEFSIGKLTFDGNRDINLKIKEKLNNLTLAKKDKNFELLISSVEKKEILAKDTFGDPSSFKITIIINVKILINNKSKNNFQIIEDFNYNNNDDKFGLKRYETQIRNNLAINATEKLIFKLSNIQ
tara:strand:+ start:317 stop:781 length:465 start_codon:yes stop_codon:yes gene_type:complete